MIPCVLKTEENSDCQMSGCNSDLDKKNFFSVTTKQMKPVVLTGNTEAESKI